MSSFASTESSEILTGLWNSMVKQLKHHISGLSVLFVVETNRYFKEALNMVLIKVRQIFIELWNSLLLEIRLFLVIYSLCKKG